MKKFLFLIFIVIFTSPIFAYEIALPGENNKLNIYGIVIMHAWYQNVNQNGKILGGSNPADGSDLIYGIQGNSRLGVNLNVEKFFFNTEFGFAGDGNDEGYINGFGLRLFNGGYKFDHGGTLTIGRQYVIADTMLTYNSLWDTDNGLAGYGTLATTRSSMIKYGIAGFEIAAINMNKFYDKYLNGNYNINGTTVKAVVTDKIMPLIEVGYNIDIPNILTGKVFLSYNGTELMINSGNLAGQRNFINSGSVGTVLIFTGHSFTITPSAFYSINGGFAGKVYTGAPGTAQLLKPIGFKTSTDAKGNVRFEGVEDISTYGVALSINYKFNDLFALEIGGGYESSTGASIRDIKDKVTSIDSFSAYIYAPIQINKYLLISPIIGYFAGQSNAITAISIDANGNQITAPKTLTNFIAGAQFRVMF